MTIANKAPKERAEPLPEYTTCTRFANSTVMNKG
jgi:hypothetical protein